nr:uncharacterized protein LOC111505377 [Leptinotarsa decemlineata]
MGGGPLRSTTPVNYEILMKTPKLREANYFTTSTSGLNNQHIFPTSNPSEVILDFPEKFIPHTQAVNNASYVPIRDKEDEYVEEDETTYTGFLPFLKMVQNKLMKYKITSHESKISVLTHLRDNLLMNIHHRISKLSKPTTSREARGYKNEEHHMEFPSNEGALMTIGFLTFAVFLIKLVMKLVYALKYKFQMYASTTTTTTAATVLLLNRKKRDEDIENASRILQYIEEFPHIDADSITTMNRIPYKKTKK